MNSKAVLLSMAFAGMVSSTAIATDVTKEVKGEMMGDCQQSNACKGKGGCKSMKNECGGKNECKGHTFSSGEKGCKEHKGKWSAKKG